jgi:NADH dehydrogenase FAD-containing subunit
LLLGGIGQAQLEYIQAGTGMTMGVNKTQIVILGGGFAGVEAARYLDRTAAKGTDVEVTLVSRDNFTLFTPMLHELAAGDLEPAHICNPLRKLLRRVTILSGDIKAIDLAARRVTISYGVRGLSLELMFDHLVLALGSETSYFGIPGVAEHALGIKSLGDAVMAGVSPSPTLKDVPWELQRGRVVVDPTLEVPQSSGVGRWATARRSSTPYPPTAQHALREGRHAGKNIYARLKGKRPTPFVYKAPGQLASIGRRTGVARVFGLKFSGVLGWVLWRTVYVMKLPRLEKKLRVVLQWVLDVAFERDLGQYVTLRDVETLNRRLETARQHNA